MGKKIEMTEDEFKKIVLILKCSKRYVNLPPNNLFLGNLWRVSSKLADKLLKRNGFLHGVTMRMRFPILFVFLTVKYW